MQKGHVCTSYGVASESPVCVPCGSDSKPTSRKRVLIPSRPKTEQFLRSSMFKEFVFGGRFNMLGLGLVPR